METRQSLGQTMSNTSTIHSLHHVVKNALRSGESKWEDHLPKIAQAYLDNGQDWVEVQHVLKDQGITGTDLKRKIKLFLRTEAQERIDSQHDLVSNSIETADAPEGHVIPNGWRVTDKPCSLRRFALRRVWASDEGEKEQAICSVPIIVPRRYWNHTRREVSVEISWKDGHKWRSEIVLAAHVSDSRALAKLASKGLPIDGENAGYIASYITDYISANNTKLVSHVICNQLGWQGKHDATSYGFVLPSGSIGNTSDKYEVTWQPEGDGEAQLGEAMSPSGTLDGWLSAVEPIKDFPIARIVLYASFASPLLEILGCNNSILDIASSTSGGKTTLLRVAGSVWSSGETTSSPRSTISTWDTTKVGLERRCSLFAHLPVLLDDTKTARKESKYSPGIAELVYMLVSGRGSARGDIRGSQATASWRTFAISTGEDRITSYISHEGAIARCLSIWGEPFGARNAETQKIVESIQDGISSNYGHAGPIFIKFLTENQAQWPALRKLFESKSFALKETLASVDRIPAGVAGRLAEAMAVISIACAVAHKCKVVPWARTEIWTPEIIDSLTDASEGADQTDMVMSYIMDKIARNIEGFALNGNVAGGRDRMGRIDRELDDDDKSGNMSSVAIIPLVFEQWLAEKGWTKNATLKALDAKGYIETESGRLTKQTRIPGIGKKKCVVISSKYLDIAQQNSNPEQE